MNKKRRTYEVPYMQKMQVEVESGFCVVASGEDANVKRKDATIAVDDYQEITNEISFD